MRKSTNKFPESDQTARTAFEDETELNEHPIAAPAVQTSGKTGKRSNAQKLTASRPELSSGNKAKRVSGAFGKR